MSFDIVFKSAKILRNVFESVQDLVQDLPCSFSTGGFYTQAMDTSHVCLMEIELSVLDDEMFEEYSITQDTIEIGIHVQNMIRALKLARGEDSCRLVWNRENSDVLKMDFFADNDNVTSFELKLMTVAQEMVGIPDMTSALTLTFDSELITRAIKDMSTLGDTVSIETSIEDDVETGILLLKLTCDGPIGKATLKLKPHSHTGSLSQETQEFALRHLASMTKASVLSRQVKIHIPQGMPLCLTFEIQAIESTMRFFLAPKIKHDEE